MTKLPLGHYITNLKLIERNLEWLNAKGLTKKEKLSYYAHIALSYAERKKKINYLGSNLYYDNIATPLNLQNYPNEISGKVLSNMHKNPKTILDVGANLGQFAITIDHVLKHNVKIDSFEPNSFIFEYLKRNTQTKENIKIHNFGLGDIQGDTTLFFDPDRTAIGSIIKQNAGNNSLMEQKIAITNTPSKITKRKIYDLVKIDVEGYEKHALIGIKELKFEYLFIELSGQTREKDYYHSEVMNLMKDYWGDYDIYYIGAFNKGSGTFDMLIRFKNWK